MTTRPPDDLHDERFDAAWRRASREEPPAALDDAIRAAARREVGARLQDVTQVAEATRPERWWFPLAAAAAIGAVAIGILQLSTPERFADDERRVVSDMPAGAKDIPSPSAPTPGNAPAKQGGPSSAPAETATREPKVAQAPAPSAKRERDAAIARAPAPPRSSSTAGHPQPPPPPLPRAATVQPQHAPAATIPSGAAGVRTNEEPPASVAERRKAVEPQPFPSRDEMRAADQKKTEAPAQAGAVAPPADAASTAEAPVGRGALKSRLAAQSAPASGDASGAPAVAGAMAPASPAAAPPPAAAAAPMAAPARMATKLAANRVAAVDALAKERAQLPIADWIARMRKLRDEGRRDDLAKELAAFRSLHADADALLPSDLRGAPAAVR